jgi:hypothetical protein
MLQYSRTGSCGSAWGGKTPFTFGNEHDVTVAAQGTRVHAAWVKSLHTLQLVQSSNGGQDWSTVTPVRELGAWHPDLAAATGTVALAWEDYQEGLPTIYLSRSTDQGATWNEQQVSLGDSFSVEPAVATDGQNTYVVWRDRRDGTWQLYLAQVSDVEPTPTATATITPTPTATSTPTSSATPTITRTATTTSTHTPTATRRPYRVLLPLMLKGE